MAGRVGAEKQSLLTKRAQQGLHEQWAQPGQGLAPAQRSAQLPPVSGSAGAFCARAQLLSSPPWIMFPRLFPSLGASPVPETCYQIQVRRETGIQGSFKGLGKNLPLGNSFLHLPGLNCTRNIGTFVTWQGTSSKRSMWRQNTPHSLIAAGNMVKDSLKRRRTRFVSHFPAPGWTPNMKKEFCILPW